MGVTFLNLFSSSWFREVTLEEELDVFLIFFFYFKFWARSFSFVFPQPFCDGSHKVTAIKPIRFEAEQSSSEIFLCGCKQTGSAPYCDGTHATEKVQSAILWWIKKKWNFSPLNTLVHEFFLFLENLLNQGSCLPKMRGMSAKRSVEMTASLQYFLPFGVNRCIRGCVLYFLIVEIK